MSESQLPEMELEPVVEPEPIEIPPEHDPTPPQMLAILNEVGQVLGYTSENEASGFGSTVPLTNEEYAHQLANPGVYTLTSEGWIFSEPEPVAPTEEEIEAEELDRKRVELEEIKTEILRDQVNEKATQMPVDKLLRIKPLLTPWETLIGVPSIKIKVPYVTFREEVYLVNQDVSVVLEHQPPGAGTEALYSKVSAPGSIGPWVQPTGAHDAYNKPGSGLPKSDPVTHNGQTWISTINANVWEPGVHGWVVHQV